MKIIKHIDKIIKIKDFDTISIEEGSGKFSVVIKTGETSETIYTFNTKQEATNLLVKIWDEFK